MLEFRNTLFLRLRDRIYLFSKWWAPVVGILILCGSIQIQLFAQPLQPDESQQEILTPVPGHILLEQSGTSPPYNDAASMAYLGLILVGLLGLIAMRSYQRIQRSKQLLDQQNKKRQQLLQQLADLDDDYAQGITDEQTYRSKRQHLKQDLIELTIQRKCLS